MNQSNSDKILQELLEHVPDEMREQVELTFRRSKFDDDSDPIFAMALHLLFLQLSYRTKMSDLTDSMRMFKEKFFVHEKKITDFHIKNIFWTKFLVLLNLFSITLFIIACSFLYTKQYYLSPITGKEENVDNLMASIRAALITKLSHQENDAVYHLAGNIFWPSVYISIFFLLITIIIFLYFRYFNHSKIQEKEIQDTTSNTSFTKTDSILSSYIKQNQEKQTPHSGDNLEQVFLPLSETTYTENIPASSCEEKKDFGNTTSDFQDILQNNITKMAFDALTKKEQKQFRRLLRKIKEKSLSHSIESY